MHDFTDFRQPHFTKFEHNTSIGVVMHPFGTEFLKVSRKKRKFFSTSSDFRPPRLRNDYTSTKIHYQMIPLRDV